MYCRSCGREVGNADSCLHNAHLSLFDKIFLYVLVVFMPITVFVYLLGYKDIEYLNNQYQFIGNLVLIVILIILLIAYYAFHKSYLVLFFGCHQMTTRSFKLKDKYFILCSRCSGILLGIFLSIFLTKYNINNQIHYLIILGLGLPLVLDGLIQKHTKYKSSNLVRFITGLLFGPTLILIYSFIQLILLKFFVMIVSYIL